MKVRDFYQIIILSFLFVVYTFFFEYKPTVGLFDKLLKVVWIVALFFILFRFRLMKGLFSTSITVILLSLVISSISSVLFWEQGLLDVLKGLAPYSFFLLLPLFDRYKVNPDVLERVILGFGVLSLFLFSYQQLIVKDFIFGGWEDMGEVRGVMRAIFPGEGFFFFTLFYLLNKIRTEEKILKYGLLIIPFLWMLVMQVTRMYFLAFGIVVIFHFLRKTKLIYKILLVGALVGAYNLYTYSTHPIVEGMRESVDNVEEIGDEYIRFLAIDYFLEEFQPNEATLILGNGAPDHSSSYGKKILSLIDNEKYYLDDLGIIGGYVLFGVLFVIGYILIYIVSLRTPLRAEDMYLKYFIIAMIIFSFTTRALTNPNFGVVMMSVIYLIRKSAGDRTNFQNLNTN